MNASILPFERRSPKDYAAGYLDGLEDGKTHYDWQALALGFLIGMSVTAIISGCVLLVTRS